MRETTGKIFKLLRKFRISHGNHLNYANNYFVEKEKKKKNTYLDDFLRFQKSRTIFSRYFYSLSLALVFKILILEIFYKKKIQ